MDINVKIWKIIDGEIEELRTEDCVVFVKKEQQDKKEGGTEIKLKRRQPDEVTKINLKLKPPNSQEFKKKQKNYRHNIKITYLEKWIKTIDFDVFTLDQFFKEYPKQKKNKLLKRNICKLIAENKILQLGKDKFKIVK